MKLTQFFHRILPATKQDIEELKDLYMATQAELTQTLKDVVVQQQKTASEIKAVQASVDELKAKIAELESVIASGEVNPDLSEAVAAVKAQAQTVDDLIPDLPTPPPVP